MGPPQFIPASSKSKAKGQATPAAGDDAQGVPMDVDAEADGADDENPEEFDPSEDPPEEDLEEEDEELADQVAAEEEQLRQDARDPEEPQDIDTEIV